MPHSHSWRRILQSGWLDDDTPDDAIDCSDPEGEAAGAHTRMAGEKCDGCGRHRLRIYDDNGAWLMNFTAQNGRGAAFEYSPWLTRRQRAEAHRILQSELLSWRHYKGERGVFPAVPRRD